MRRTGAGWLRLGGCGGVERDHQRLLDSLEAAMRDQLAGGLKWPAIVAAGALIAGVLWLSPLALKNAAPPSQDAREVKPVDQIAPELALPRRRLYVTIVLPSGFGPGTYEIQVVDPERRSRASASGLAAFRDGSPMLQTTLDLTSIPSGAYQLAVRRQSEDWHRYPAHVQ
jgi:hypothetical protein